MSVEFLLLRNQVLDYAESQDQYEAMLGQLLDENTEFVDGELFGMLVREILDGLQLAMKRFDQEWEVIK